MKKFIYRLIPSILIFIFSMIYHMNYDEIKKINKEELNPIIKIEDYGFKDVKIYDSLLGQSKYINEIGEAYHLDLHCADNSNSYFVDVMIYKWDNKEIARNHYENEIELARQEYVRRVGKGSYLNSVVPKIPYNKAIDYMIPLDLNEWNIDEGYSTTDINTEITSEMSTVFVILLREDQVMVIDYTNNLLLNPDNIKIFNRLFEESKELFK